MRRIITLLVPIGVAVALSAWIAPRTAYADDDEEEAEILLAEKFDPASCVDVARPAGPLAPGDVAPPPVTWKDYEVVGTFTDAPATVRAIFGPTLDRQRALTDDARTEIRRIANGYGYHLVGLGTKETPTGTRAIVHIAPLPIVRRIKVDVAQSILTVFTQPIFEDELRRRLRTRVGSYLPWSPLDRACARYEEAQQLEEYLRDEGFFDARVAVREKSTGSAVELRINVRSLGTAYETGTVNIEGTVTGTRIDEIQDIFRHDAGCLPVPGIKACWGVARFRRDQHQKDIQRVVDLFHKRGYPSVRVRSDFDPLTSFNRTSRKVNVTITIDERRKIDVQFEGHDGVASSEDLQKQLTFSKAASADDVEVGDSAKALAAYLQSRGFFDARVTWQRERFDVFDRIVFRIHAGNRRRVESLQIIGARRLTVAQIRAVVGTTEVTRTSALLGRSVSATSERLSLDVEGIRALYLREGFRDVKVAVSAANTPAGLDDVGAAAGLVLAKGGKEFHVRFTIDEGEPTMLAQIEITLGPDGDKVSTPEQRVVCTAVLRELASYYNTPSLANPRVTDRCIVTASTLRYKEQEALDTRDRLKERLYSIGRPRAKVSYELIPLGPNKMLTRYKLTDIQPLTIGKVVVRGNFKTDRDTILSELRFIEGQPLTKETLADGARRLRSMGLFDAVNVALPDLENTSAGQVNAVVEVAERHDYRLRVDLEAGFSSYNGVFFRLGPSFKNLFGRGISLDLSGTIGFKPAALFEEADSELKQLGLEATLRFPEWLSRRYIDPPEWLTFATELTGFHRLQDTERFGRITTDGATLALSHTTPRARTETRDARALTYGIYYDFRLRERPVDVLRPVGADDDQDQVPIRTRTGSVGVSFEWEQRVDDKGNLSPLLPDRGYRWEAQLSIAAPELFGQDTFLKAAAAGSVFHTLGDVLLLRGDLRYDHGFPLRGAVLLPEVERYFAGGDSTVRGYEDDRLATELIRVTVPPFEADQLRVLPAGGNIRALGSLDAQVRLWSVFASAIFVDAGMIANDWSAVDKGDIRPSVGVALVRLVTPFGIGAIERAVPLNPQLGDNPRGRWHISFAARAQF